MIQINPKERFVISRGLPDASDTSTYYIRAFVRDAIKDSLLATVTLTDKGSQRFQAEYEAPADPTGNGLQIIISTIVYTDSGYTTISPDYGIEYVEYLVQTRYNPALPQNGMVGDDINYKKIKKIVEEVIGSRNSEIISSIPKQIDADRISSTISNSTRDIIVDVTQKLLDELKIIEKSLKENKTVYVQQEASKEFKKEIREYIDAIAENIYTIKDALTSIDVRPVVNVEKDKFGELTFQFLKKLFTRKKDIVVEVVPKMEISDEFGIKGEKSVGFINEFGLKI